MSKEHIKHLYWRAGFGLDPTAWREGRNWSVEQAVERLFSQAARFEPLSVAGEATGEEEMQAQGDAVERLRRERRQVAQLSVDWLRRMADPGAAALLERVSLFWHGHFACRVLVGKLAVNYLDAIRRHALGPFRDLCLAIARDPAMIRYLNNQQNKRRQPNENFARELMELFTIGRGHYTEQDVREAARAFTGWSSDLQGNYVFRAIQHDYDDKTFFGRTGNFDGEDIIDMILERRETAEFLVRKIWRHFVSSEEDQGLIATLSRRYYDSGYHTGQLLRTIFTADWFYDARYRGAVIKSPSVLMAGLLSQLKVDFHDELALLLVQRRLGQELFNPPNVAGWPGGRAWIDNATLLLRLNLGAYLLTSGDVAIRDRASEEGDAPPPPRRLRATVDLTGFQSWWSAANGEASFDELSNYLLAVPSRLRYAGVRTALQDVAPEQQPRHLLAALLSSPEYQLS